MQAEPKCYSHQPHKLILTSAVYSEREERYSEKREGSQWSCGNAFSLANAALVP